MNKHRILFLDQTGQLGGAELSLIDLAYASRHNSLTLLFEDGPLTRLFEQRDIPVKILHSSLHEIKANSGIDSLVKVPKLFRLISSVVKECRDFDVIYTNTPKAAFIGTIAGWVARRPVIVHLRDILTSKRYSSLNRALFTFFSGLANRVVVNSSATQRAFVECGGRIEKTRLLYNGFKCNDRRPLSVSERRSRLNCLIDAAIDAPLDMPVIGCFSRISEWKGQSILLDALAKIEKPICVLMVGGALFGEQSYEQELHRQARQLSPNKTIVFTGFRSDVDDLMRLCDLIVHPTIDSEPFGRSVVEAQLAGCPVIASDGGGVPEIIEHGVNGFLVKPACSKSLAHQIIHCLENPKLCSAIASAAYRSAREKFGLQNSLDRFNELVHEVMQERDDHLESTDSRTRSESIPTVETVGINARFLHSRITGVERYALNVLEHLIPEIKDQGQTAVLFVPKNARIPDELKAECVTIVECNVWPTSIGHHAWEQFRLPALAKANNVDVLLNLTNTAPVSFANNVITIHDLSWIENPSCFSMVFKLGYNFIVPLAARRALKIVTVSHCSAQSVSRHLSVPSSRISVIPEGSFIKSASPAQEVLEHFGIDRPYFLHVGTLQPRKNIERLIRGHQLLFNEFHERTPYLVLAGGSAAHFARTGIGEFGGHHVKLLGYVTDAQLQALYAGALSYVTASLSEGFNLPIVEAMASGIPVVASKIPIHEEVAGDAALFFDPLSEGSIHQAFKTILCDNQLRGRLRRSGAIRSSRYSWETHAKEMMKLIAPSCNQQTLCGAGAVKD